MKPAAPKPDDTALREAQERFIGAWGQMGSTWGISRTMAEIFALLYITGDDLCTDDVMERLEISRGNASMSLRALVDWGIVSKAHRRGDRKEYFRAEQDVWAFSRQVLRERMRREIHPLLASLFEIRDLTGDATPRDADARAHNERLDELLKLVQMLDKLMERLVGSEGRGLRLAASVLSKIP